MALTQKQKETQILAWANGTGPKPAWTAANLTLTYVKGELSTNSVSTVVSNPWTTENTWWVNTPSASAAPNVQTAQQQLTAYITGTGPKPAWLSDIAASQAAGVESLRRSVAEQPGAAAGVDGWVSTFLASGVNSNVYRGGAAYETGMGNPPSGGTGAGTTEGAGGSSGGGSPAGSGAPAGFHPVPFVTTGSGVADPNQPVGAGFGTDYGLPVGSDPNFAFGNPTGDQSIAAGTSQGAAQPFTPQPGQIVATPNGAPFTSGSLAYSTRPDGTVQIYSPAGTFGAFHPLPTGVTIPPNLTQPTVIGTTAHPTTGSSTTGHPTTSGGTTGHPTTSGGGTASTSSGTAAQQNALATLKSTLDTYGLGSMASWAWSEIVAGKSQDQVLLDLQQRPEFKARFPAIEARQQAGLPPISPGEYVSYENQATQLMRQAGLPSGFWDSPSDFTHLLSGDVSINELGQRLNLATQAAYQVPADVRASLARDYGVGPGQLAAFFLDEKTAMPLISRDFTAAQIGGAAYRTGYGSTKAQDERLTDLGVTPGQAQQGFNQLTLQRQLFSALPGENTTGVSRDDQLAATFGGDTKAQEEILRRSQSRVAAFAGGGAFAAGGVGTAQGA